MIGNISQNARFEVRSPTDPEFPHPPGAGLARLLFEELPNVGWITSDLENWRDCGWSFIVSSSQATLLIALSRWKKDDQWMLQIVPKKSAGLLNRLFGFKPSAGRSDISRLASVVHEILRSRANYRHALWRWNGYPAEGVSNDEPQS